MLFCFWGSIYIEKIAKFKILLDLLFYSCCSCICRLVAAHPGPTACMAVYLLEMAVVVVGLASAATLAYRALHPHHYRAPLFLTDKQFRLLHLHPDTPGIGPSTHTTTSSSVSFICTQTHQVQGPPSQPLQGPPLPHTQAVSSPSPAPRHIRYRALHPHHYRAPLFLTDKQFCLLHLHSDTPGT